jgi:hypothetical protein
MTRVKGFTIAAIAFLCIAAANSPPVTFESPCECRDNHGKHRWAVKIDPSLPPTDASVIQAVRPSDIYSWPGPDLPLTQSSERTGIENNWYALTGRVVALKVEADGDLHMRFKMRLATNRASLLLKYRRNRNGARFATRSLVGRGHGFLFTRARRES